MRLERHICKKYEVSHVVYGIFARIFGKNKVNKAKKQTKKKQMVPPALWNVYKLVIPWKSVSLFFEVYHTNCQSAHWLAVSVVYLTHTPVNLFRSGVIKTEMTVQQRTLACRQLGWREVDAPLPSTPRPSPTSSSASTPANCVFREQRHVRHAEQSPAWAEQKAGPGCKEGPWKIRALQLNSSRRRSSQQLHVVTLWTELNL